MSSIASKVCGKCKQIVKGRTFLLCTECNLYFHIECKGYEKRYYLLEPDRKAKWKCDICLKKNYNAKNKIAGKALSESVPSSALKNKDVECFVNSKKFGISSIIPALNLPECEEEVIDPYVNVTCRKNSTKRSSVCSDDDSSSQTESALEITTALKDYITQQMSTMTHQLLTKMDTLASSIQKFNIRCNGIEQRLSSMEKRLDEKDEKVNNLEVTIDRLRTELNDKDQESLVNEVEISGIPEMNGENPVHIVTLIGNKLGVKFAESDVVSAVRVGARRMPTVGAPAPVRPKRPAPPGPPVSATGPESAVAAEDEPGPRLLVVRLLRRAQRDELLRAARVRRGADTTGLGLPGPPHRFYINERLTRANRVLFRRAREETRRLEWKFAWTRDGAILVRREHGEPAKRIRTEDDLVRVFCAKIVSEN